MSDEKNYKIDLDLIRSNFINQKGLTHRTGNKFKLLPYVANEKTLVTNFDGVLGSFSRIINNKELNKQFSVKDFLDDITDEIGDFQNSTVNKLVFTDIVRTMFIQEDKLVDFNIKTLNYITSTSADDKIAKFLYSIFLNEELKVLVKEKYDKKEENILYKLVLNALPELEEKQYSTEEYNCYLPFIRDSFIRDFKFLAKNEDLYKKSIKRFLEFYYMFYVSQLAMKLSKFERADINNPDPIYYTLSWESTSKTRTAYKFGWELLKCNVNSLFSHAITLELLNHHGLDMQLGYVELFNLFKEVEVPNQIEEICNEYMSHIKDVSWSEFEFTNRYSGSLSFNNSYNLFEAIQFQFNKTSRSRANEAYRNWFVKFVYHNFSKKRGPLGYNLSITEEDIILMTKICINDNDKIKLNLLFFEFEKRGLFFDRDSKYKIVQLYEKLNLLEKKSDSGDAQYVRSIL